MRGIPNSAPAGTPAAAGRLTVGYKPKWSGVCRIDDAPITGQLEIVYRPGDTLLEFGSVDKWLNAHRATPTTLEEFVVRVFQAVSSVVGDDTPLVVTGTVQGITHAEAIAKVDRGEDFLWV